MGTLKYKGYIGTVEYSEEDNCLFGKVQGLHKIAITYDGDSLADLEADFKAGVDDYLHKCEERGVEPVKPYSGSLNVRLTPDLHGKVAAIAQQLGISINAVIKNALTDFTKHAL